MAMPPPLNGTSIKKITFLAASRNGPTIIKTRSNMNLGEKHRKSKKNPYFVVQSYFLYYSSRSII